MQLNRKSLRCGCEMAMASGSRSASDWFYGRPATSLQEGYIPANYVALAGGVANEDWFFGSVCRKRCELLLSQQRVPRGAFMIRESESFPGMYTISVKNADDKRKASISHYRIHKSNPNPTYYIAENRKFGSLSALVEYYKGAENGLNDHLTNPFTPLPFPSSRRSFPTSQGRTPPQLPPRRSSVSSAVAHVSTKTDSLVRKGDLSLNCQSCDEELATVKFLPCGHTLFCDVCSLPMKKCTQCRSRIESKLSGSVKKKTVREVELLKHQLNKVIQERQCEICMERTKTMVFNPCGHGACPDCSGRLRNCHMCRRKITSKIKTFI